MENRQITIDYLRGIAALMVCMLHFRHAVSLTLNEFLKYGTVGVQIFFVISGYIIPFSLIRSGYNVSCIHKFWMKRLLRLYPPFLVALILTFILSHSAAYVKEQDSMFGFSNFLYSMAYWEIPAENPVIWTLIVELKYYLFISVLFPLFFTSTPTLRRLSFVSVTIIAVFFVNSFEFLQYLPYFLIGFSVCYFVTGMLQLLECVILISIECIALLLLKIVASIPYSLMKI